MSDHTTLTQRYLQQTDAVLAAGKVLRATLAANPIQRELAISSLEQATAAQTGDGQRYRAFMFSEMGAEATITATSQQIRLTEDALASILVDMKVANVLLAAGQTLGETGAAPQPKLLGDALSDLDRTVQGARPVLAQDLADVDPRRRMGFLAEDGPSQLAEVGEPESVVMVSPDLPAARDAFKHQVADTMEAIILAARGVVAAVVDGLDGFDPDTVKKALTRLGVQVGELPRVGRLVRQGLAKMAEMIDSLVRLVGSELLNQVRDQVVAVWQRILQGDLIADVLAVILRRDETVVYARSLAGDAGVTVARLDAATRDLRQLAERFGEAMSLGESVVSTVAFGAAIATLVPGIAEGAAGAAASLLGLVLAISLLTAMDYADAGVSLGRVRGVRLIAESLRVASR